MVTFRSVHKDTFYVDVNGNAELDAGEPNQLITPLHAGETRQIGPVQNVSISGGVHPTISWEPVKVWDPGLGEYVVDPGVYSYSVRFYTYNEHTSLKLDGPFYQRSFAKGSSAYSFTILLFLFGDIYQDHLGLWEAKRKTSPRANTPPFIPDAYPIP